MNFPELDSALWIASPLAGSPRTGVPAPYLRKAFHLNAEVKHATLQVTALGLYECEINAQRVSDSLFTPGWTDTSKRVQVQEYDVTSYLKMGDNAIGVLLGDGWHSGRVGWQRRESVGRRPQLLLHLTLHLANGETIFIRSDESWKTAPSPLLENDLIEGESYDSRQQNPAWSSPGCDERNWTPVILCEPPQGKLCAMVGPLVKRQETLSPICKKRITKGELFDGEGRFFDLGQNMTGWARITVKAAPGRTLKIRYAEMLNPDGTLYFESLRTARATDFYTCHSSEKETWEPRFTFHGFRYISIFGLQAGDEVDAEGIVIHSELPPTGHFACSNSMLNQLHHNISWGLKGNFLDVPTDCPQRDERLGWTGDAQVFIRTACFHRDVRSFFHKWLRDMRDAQRESGAIPSVVPNVANITVEDGGPAWSDAVIICPWTLYLCYNDLDILQEHYPAMKRYLEFIENHRCKDSIRSHPDVDAWGGHGDWLSMETNGTSRGTMPADLIGTAYFAYILSLMAETATLLSLPEEAEMYRERRVKVVQAFRDRFVTAQGQLVSGTQTAYVLALVFDLLPEHQRAVAGAELVRNIQKRDYHLSTGFVGTPYLLFALEKSGHLDVAYRLLEQTTYPSWLFPITNGATTIWERWDGWTPEKGFQNKDMNSFNHYAYGAVGAWMVQSVAGLDIDPKQPGYRHILFVPKPGGSLTWAEASLKTAQGTVSIRWELTQNGMEIALEVPSGCTATLFLPTEYGGETVNYTSGRFTLCCAGKKARAS